jgi:hypothetical protein
MLTLKIDSQAHLSPASELSAGVLARIKDRLSFPNPAYLEAENGDITPGTSTGRFAATGKRATRLSSPGASAGILWGSPGRRRSCTLAYVGGW